MDIVIRFSNEGKAFTVLVVKMKDSSIEQVKDLILQPSKSPSKLFIVIVQYKDTDDTLYLHRIGYFRK